MDSSILLLAAIFVCLFVYTLSYKRSGPCPPGPRPLPLIGNLLDLPHENEWVVYNEWAQKWGNLVMVKTFGRNILIVNDSNTATNLLEHHSATTSGRPLVTMAFIAGWDNVIVEKNADDPNFKTQRKMLHKLIGTAALAGDYNHIQEQETKQFLRRILKDSSRGELMDQIQSGATAIVLRMVYGYQVKEINDSYVPLVKRVVDAFNHGSLPHSFLVNMFPALNRLPNWFPGTGFKKIGEQWRKEFFESVEIPLQFAKKQAAAGASEAPMAVRLLEEPEGEDKQNWEDNVKYAMNAIYGAGSDTTTTAIHAFFKAMILHPEVQRKAQAEIDALTGGLRLPVAGDRQSLPYVNAMVSEVLRWHTLAPFAVPHAVSKDMEFEGYSIPKGTIILPNVWAMCHDSKTYHDPFTFEPSRFLATDGTALEQDPRAFVFGFGRRICPGRYLADNGIFLACAMSLAVFDILPAHDEHGTPILPDTKASSGIVSHQSLFEYDIRPRSADINGILLGN